MLGSARRDGQRAAPSPYHGLVTPEASSNAAPYEPVAWRDGRPWLLDQTLLPAETRYIELASVEAVAEAISVMRVRGAPAIGVTAAYALALAAAEAPSAVAPAVKVAAEQLAATRPTAVNLRWALDRVAARVGATSSDAEARAAALDEARAIHEQQRAADARMAALGAELLPEGARVLTLCNTGPLATAGGGTALGVVIAGWRAGRIAEVLACETRPRLQGARLTAWELQQHGVPFRLVVEGAAASLMAAGRLSAVVVGADRVAANGDTANKIGTYMLAVLARHHEVPCYVVAPASTLDPATTDGAAIPIEERDESEVLRAGGTDLAAPGARALNPAFDVTPAELIDAIVTERGVLRAPYPPSIAAALDAPAGSHAAEPTSR
jgi:methylthioribose-1-phosphate isomerase